MTIEELFNRVSLSLADGSSEIQQIKDRIIELQVLSDIITKTKSFEGESYHMQEGRELKKIMEEEPREIKNSSTHVKKLIESRLAGKLMLVQRLEQTLINIRAAQANQRSLLATERDLINI